MCNERVKQLANNVLARKHIGINDAMQSLLGEYTPANANLYNDVWDEVQNILYPHGTGEDSTYIEY